MANQSSRKKIRKHGSARIRPPVPKNYRPPVPKTYKLPEVSKSVRRILEKIKYDEIQYLAGAWELLVGQPPRSTPSGMQDEYGFPLSDTLTGAREIPDDWLMRYFYFQTGRHSRYEITFQYTSPEGQKDYFTIKSNNELIEKIYLIHRYLPPNLIGKPLNNLKLYVNVLKQLKARPNLIDLILEQPG